MSGGLPVPTGGASGGAVTEYQGGAPPAEYVGDMSVDRGGTRREPQAGAISTVDPASIVDKLPPVSQALIADLARDVGARLTADQVRTARVTLLRHMVAQDERDNAAVEQLLRTEWGPHWEQRLELAQRWLVNSLGPEVADEIIYARADSGHALCNNPAVLLAFAKAADRLVNLSVDRSLSAERGAASQGSGTSTADDHRIAELEAWMAQPKGSVDYRRYYDDPKAQEEYRVLIGRRST